MADRADHQFPSQQANPGHISANAYPRPVPHQSHGHNPPVVDNDRQGVHQEGVPQPVGDVVVQDEIQYLPRIEVPNYNVAHGHPPPLPYYPEVPYMHMYRDVGVVEAAPAQAHHFAPEVQGNHDGLFGYGAQFPVADPPEAFLGAWNHRAPPADMPPANSLRNLAGRYLNNPGTHVKVLLIEPSPGGRFKVWIALELVDIF